MNQTRRNELTGVHTVSMRPSGVSQSDNTKSATANVGTKPQPQTNTEVDSHKKPTANTSTENTPKPVVPMPRPSESQKAPSVSKPTKAASTPGASKRPPTSAPVVPAVVPNNDEVNDDEYEEEEIDTELLGVNTGSAPTENQYDMEILKSLENHVPSTNTTKSVAATAHEETSAAPSQPVVETPTPKKRGRKPGSKNTKTLLASADNAVEEAPVRAKPGRKTKPKVTPIESAMDEDDPHAYDMPAPHSTKNRATSSKTAATLVHDDDDDNEEAHSVASPKPTKKRSRGDWLISPNIRVRTENDDIDDIVERAVKRSITIELAEYLELRKDSHTLKVIKKFMGN